MQKSIAFALLLLWKAVAMAAQPSESGPALVFSHVNIIDATGAPMQADMTVIVQGERIIAIAKSGTVQIPLHATLVESRGKFIIPGLWDMHVHTVFGDW